jgi:predicted nucleic acid-binding protein
MSGSIFVDTNVLVYSRDASRRDKQAQAAEWISHLWETGNGRLSVQVIAEFYAVVTGKLKPGMEAAKAREDVEDLFSWQPLPMTPDLIHEAWSVQDLFHLSWWDSLIVSAAKIQQCTYLLSEDFQHSQDFQGILVINPFRMKPVELR